jgi:DNA-binding GntR family transcriptional regulator
MDLRVEPVTVIGQAVRNLRAAIMQGDFRPGEHLPEADLCGRLGISRASLREALRCLVTEQMIEMVPNRGYFVARLDEQKVEDIGEVWTVLTTAAVGKFTRQATPADLTAMRAAIFGLQRAVKSGEVTLQLEMMHDFFRVIYKRGGNRVWSEMITTLTSRIHALRRMSLRVADQGSVVAQLYAIFVAVEAKDAATAMDATGAHIRASCEAAREFCRQGEKEAVLCRVEDAPLAR